MSLFTSFIGSGGGLLGNFLGGGSGGGGGGILTGSTSSSSSGGLATRIFTSPAFWMAGALVVVVLIK